MKKRLAVLLSLIFSFSVVSSAQTKTVTNADLEKFRQERLKAEREYRENYERLGFPSPEELERQREEDRRRREELSAQLKAERLQREAIKAQNEQNQAIQNPQIIVVSDSQNGGYYGFGHYPYGFSTYGNRFHRQRYGGIYNDRNVFPNGRFVPIANPGLPLSIRSTFPHRNPNLRYRQNNPAIKINIGGGRKR